MNRLQMGAGLSHECPGIDGCLLSGLGAVKSQSNALILFTIDLNGRLWIKRARHGFAQGLRNSFNLAKG